MKTQNKSLSALFIVLLVIVTAAAALATEDQEEQERPIKWEELPEVVQKTILKHAGSFKIEELETVTIGAEVFYLAEWIDGDKEVEIRIAQDGKLIERKVEDLDDDEEDDDEDD
jgi:hypothetical protein